VRTWANAPISYVLALVRFPAVAGMEDFVSAFGQEVEDIYPRRTEHMNQVALAEFGSEGMKFKTSQQTFWQFSREDRSRAVMIGPDFIVLHCIVSGYSGHEAFVTEIISMLGKLSSLPGITLTHLTSMGYRYVNLVIPAEGEMLSKYLASWVIPFEGPPTDIGNMDFVDSVSVSAFRTRQGVLRFQVARRPSTTIPPDLDSLFVRENDWVVDRPSGDFVLLDLDHGQQFSAPVALSEEDAIRTMIEVCQVSRKLFHMSVTPLARQTWEGGR